MIDYFGYMDLDYTINFNNVRICPVAKHEEMGIWIKKYTHKDGFVYPPISNEVVYEFGNEKKKRIVPNTERPALLHKLPYSHSINIPNLFDSNWLRKWDYVFLINLLGLAKGTRLQFYNWWFDGRVPIKIIEDIIISQKAINDFLSVAYETWNSWKDINKQRMINLLVMHTRVPTYEWDYERFLLNYMVFDGAFNIASKIHKCKSTTHKDQFYSVIDKFGLAKNDEHINNIYKLRNDLFHHAIWDGGFPNSAGDKYKGWIQESVLRKFNIRLLVALLNYETGFIQSPWWTVGKIPIDSNLNK